MTLNGAIVPHLDVDPATSKPREIDMATATCGTNRYVGVVNYLEFYLTPGCQVNVIPRDAILSSVRLQWTAAEFFADGGTTTFTQRLGAVLGVDYTRIKVVSVYEGSLIIDFQVLANVDPVTVEPNGAVNGNENSY